MGKSKKAPTKPKSGPEDHNEGPIPDQEEETAASNSSQPTMTTTYYTSRSRRKEKQNRPSHIQQLLYQVLEKMIDEIKQDKNMLRLQSEVIDPLIQYSFRRMYPYIMVTTVIVLLLLITVIASLTLIIRLNFSK